MGKEEAREINTKLNSRGERELRHRGPQKRKGEGRTKKPGDRKVSRVEGLV